MIEENEVDARPAHSDGDGSAGTDLVYDRFELLDKLGEGGQATTWLALDMATETEVALKELSLDRAVDWKAVELFEREGQALASLDHPSIPDYIDAFHVESDEGASRFFLAQEYVRGDSLLELIEQRETFDHEAAAELLEDLLSVLAYLHTKSPPVIHRDIKPSNILIDDDGRPALIDFGAVQIVLPETVGGSTIIGTTGYFPLEQLMGKAVPASDLYAVGATMVHVLGGVHPAELDMERNRLQFEEVVDVPQWMVSFLSRLLEPAAEDRFEDALAALEFFRRLRGGGDLPGEVGRSSAATAGEDEAGWLQAVNGRQLVENRATPSTTYRIECASGASALGRVEREPGEVEVTFFPDHMLVLFESGKPKKAIDTPEIVIGFLMLLMLALPLTLGARFSLVMLLLVPAVYYLVWRHQSKKLRYEIYADRVEASGDTQVPHHLLYPRQVRFGGREGKLLLEREEGDVIVADGLSDEQLDWLIAKLERGRGDLVDHQRLDVDAS